LLIHHVPFVNTEGAVEYGVLVSELTTDGTRAIQPGNHQIWVVGGVPHDHQGKVLSIVNVAEHDYGGGLVAACSISGKKNNQSPPDYYEKISHYVALLGSFAKAIEPTATHTSFPIRESSDEESVFRYHDAATSRSGLSAVAAKLEVDKVAIVGLGGTGAYILDLLAKTPVGEIHLYDDDEMAAHNAFRSPGAATQEQLQEQPRKVDYLQAQYDAMRRGIFAHPERVDAANVEELHGMSFVFVAVDTGPDKRAILEALLEWGVPFIDTGIGVLRRDNALRGTIRVTTATSSQHDHVKQRVSYAVEGDDEYSWNIQTADLNMMNAVMAVVKWKKLCGYYEDTKHEYHSTLTVARNQMVNSEVAETA
jgi:hypothetical protein